MAIEQPEDPPEFTEEQKKGHIDTNELPAVIVQKRHVDPDTLLELPIDTDTCTIDDDYCGDFVRYIIDIKHDDSVHAVCESHILAVWTESIDDYPPWRHLIKRER